MRPIVLTALAAFAAAPACASSIEVISGTRLGNDSMVSVSCAECPPQKVENRSATYTVPKLEEGVQKEEIRVIRGEKVIMRTDKWMGGSPTVFYQKPMPEVETAAPAKPVIEGGATPVAADASATPSAPDGIDPTTTTSAVSATPAKAVDDFSGFELRLR